MFSLSGRGSIKRVVMVSFPPVGVNLHALLRTRARAGQAHGSGEKGALSAHGHAPGQVRDDLPETRLVPNDDPIFPGLLLQSTFDDILGLAHRIVQSASRNLRQMRQTSDRVKT